MTVRDFDAVDDQIQCSIGGCSTTEAFTWSLLLKRQSISNWHCLMANHDSGGTAQLRLYFRETNVLYIQTPTGGASQSTTQFTSTTIWYLIFVTSGGSGTTPRFHWYDLDSGVWVHQNGNATINLGSAQTGGTVRFGTKQGADFADMRLGAAAQWVGLNMSDAQVEAIVVDALATSSLLAAAGGQPAGLWQFNQESAAIPIEDLSGVADQSSITGTTAVAGDDPPGWGFDLGGPPPPPDGAYRGVKIEGDSMRYG